MPQAMKWTPEVVIATIQSLHRRKRPLHSSYMQRHNVTLYVASCKRFGGWPQAITAAGLDYAAVRAQPPQKVWSKDAVKEEILRRHREELTLSASEVQKEDNRLTWAATKYFGKRGWNKALTYAGLDYRDFDTRIIWSKKTVIEAIQRRQEQKLPLNVGIVIDRSGSMADQNKLNHAKQAAKEFINNFLGSKWLVFKGREKHNGN